ncbi:TaqI-like C-terminal specificity domain-containing protein [Marivirga atlantica]|uniref:site-specific DNA-methyltransferase (adenine-specific) n=1 Tax=Marivirga atlantica TaxID=1548457 RepID=A0A937DD73_9BACT|nr:TaqI-like C-terminal specificity domain-containing protein [Marivirga atlantica]MBL0763907.1 class I SAM-dependent DNA methyltransferase [Marivirga atlantica]
MEQILKPRKALNKAFLKVKPYRESIEIFKTNLIQLIDRTNDTESEEFHKNLVIDFLKKTYYDPDHFINTKGRNDLVIHTGNQAKTNVGVIIEAKKPTNKAEMLSTKQLNTKALQELVLYYLRERVKQENKELKHLIATNINEWFIFDAQLFEKLFYNNKSLLKEFNDFEAGRLSGKTTDFFYKEIAQPVIEKNLDQFSYTYFDLSQYEKPLRNENKKDDNKLIVLFKLLSPEHLLKLPFANDSNSLDKKFYAELLHIIGLSEAKQGGKKVIERKKDGERDEGSLLENAITQLEAHDKIYRLEKPSRYGATNEERLFNVGLELVISWVNRILFLKLMEAQLINYHKGDQDYAFLNFKKINNYDDLDSLFFQVLAKKFEDRKASTQEKFSKVPYLNSSLFEASDLEHNALFVSNLRDELTLPVLSSTVLKDQQGKKLKGELNTLQYLFAFLEAYDFSSEGAEEIQEENKTLINASVLGLIFEKINGYKDGSFFTPGFITMYMCRETIRRAVVQKFNEVKGWECQEFDELYDKIEDRSEANEIINSLKICDPAVGSGHFLVSALNEMIAIKNDLKILQDRNGKRLKEYQFEIENDELVITDDDGDLFEYSINNKESQRVQETLFHEKQNIIENCLFGVDINPNSVKICRLRLWIELLKNAYYKNETELETLPNIDINIKCGNSLISRFDLDADIKKALKSSKWSIDSYKLAVDSYRNAQSKEEKREMERLISDIKSDFRSEISKNDPKIKRKAKLGGELYNLTQQQGLFEVSKAEEKKRKKEIAKIEQQLDKLETEIAEIKDNKIYENAFEWRFEFPEVLDNNGNFKGFDIIIGNPPYIRQEELSDIKQYLGSNFLTFAGTADLYVYFVELGLNLLKDGGDFTYIIPNKWMRAGYGQKLRSFVKSFQIEELLDFGDLPVFEEATTYPLIISLKKSKPNSEFQAVNFTSLDFDVSMKSYINQNKINVLIKELADQGWTLTDSKVQKLLIKLRTKGKPLGKYVEGKIFRGVLTGLNEAFVINKEIKDRLISEDPSSKDVIKPFLSGRDIKRYRKPEIKNYIILFKNGDTKKWFGDLSEADAIKKMNSKYPAIMSWLDQFKERAIARYDKGQYWWELRACDYYEEFEKEKIAWPETSMDNQFTIVEQGNYLNKTAFIIPLSDKSLLGQLNSSVAKFFFDSIVSKMRGGYFSMSKAYVETFPVIEKAIEEIDQRVVEILTIKRNDPKINTIDLVREIDQLVYKMYELTEDEIKIVEGTLIN